jgi:pimeloyl-ACP methyl ester carboxylesterase
LTIALGLAFADTAAAPSDEEIKEMETVRSTDGTTIAYARQGRGKPLVLVHGASADHTRFVPVLGSFTASFTVYAVDRRGRGRSGDAPDYALEREYEDVIAVINVAPEPVFLLGHSFGGICALEAALRSDRVRKLVLYEPPVAAPPTNKPAEFEALLASGRREEVLGVFLRDLVRVPPEEMQLLRALPSWAARVAAAHTIPREVRAVEGYRIDAERLGVLPVPTLLLLGGDSPPFMRDGTERLRAAISGSRVVVMPGQQHSAMNTAPEVFVREVTSFLEE